MGKHRKPRVQHVKRIAGARRPGRPKANCTLCGALFLVEVAEDICPQCRGDIVADPDSFIGQRI